MASAAGVSGRRVRTSGGEVKEGGDEVNVQRCFFLDVFFWGGEDVSKKAQKE